MFLEKIGLQEITSIAKVIDNNRKYFLPTIKKINYWLTKGRTQIAVFGAGGTGKTTLGHFVTGNLNPFQPFAYTQSKETEHYAIPNDTLCNLIAVPGQKESGIASWDQLFSQIRVGKAIGVINVVCYGYHSLRSEGVVFSEESEELNQQEFLASYVPQKQNLELQRLKELLPHLQASPRKITMVTLVAKQDLWWNNRKKVKQHYLEGEYQNYIDQVLKAKGQQNFSHEYLSTSFVINNLTQKHQVLLQNHQGYGQNLQAEHLQWVLDKIKSIAEKG